MSTMHRSSSIDVGLRKGRVLRFIVAARQRAEDAIDAKAAQANCGAATGALSSSADGRGYFKPFGEGRWILWRDDLGAHLVYGAINGRWVETGGVKGFLGWPLTDECPVPAGPARFNHFEGGSIYWSPSTGAHLIYGAIRDLWASMAWEQGPLGMPTTDEEDVAGVAGPAATASSTA